MFSVSVLTGQVQTKVGVLVGADVTQSIAMFYIKPESKDPRNLHFLFTFTSRDQATMLLGGCGLSGSR